MDNFFKKPTPIPPIYWEMKRQEKVWSCGAAAARNAMRCFGIKVPESQVRRIAGTTKDFGTCEQGIMRAVREYGLTAVEHHFSDKEEAWEWLHETLIGGKKVILAVECWEHWVIALGSGGDDVIVFDPSNFKNNVYENRCHSWNKKKTMYKWYNDRKSIDDETEQRIYAISVGKR